MKRILKTVMALCLLFTANTAFAQGWPWASKSNGTGTEQAYGIHTDVSGNNYITGAYSNGNAVFGPNTLTATGVSTDGFLAKTNSTGTFQWGVRIAASMSDYGQCVATNGTDVFVAGLYRSTITFFSTTAATASLTGVTTDDECYIARYNSAGVVQWAVKYTGVLGTGQSPRGITINNSLNVIYVTGVTGGKLFTNCYNFTGTLLWSNVSSNTGGATGFSVVTDGAAGNSYVVARYSAGPITLGAGTYTGTNGALLVKYDNAGVVQWVTNIGAAGGDEYPRGGLGIDGAGNLYIGGDYSGAGNISGILLPVTGAARNFFIAKYNSAGTVQWAQGAGGTGTEHTYGFATDASGNSYLGINQVQNNSIAIDCQTFPAVLGNTDNKFIVVAYDNLGAVKWAGAPVASNDQTSTWGISTDGNGAIVTGLTIASTSFGATALSSPTSADAFVAKVSSSIPTISGVTICSGNTATLTPTAPTGAGFTFNWWSAPTGGTLLFTGPSYTTPVLTTTTTYYLTVAPNGCFSTRVPVTVTVNPTPTVTITGGTTLCSGASTTLTASGATTYFWIPGGAGSSITVSPTVTTTYIAFGTTSGCTSAASTVVTVNPSPTITATASPATLTPPSVATSYITTSTSGGSGFTYSWSPSGSLNSATIANPVATPTVTTVYTVTVTNSAGCSAQTTVTVTVTPQTLCQLPLDYNIPPSSSVTSIFGAATGVTGANIQIDGVFTLDASFNFSMCNIVMKPGSSIQTTSGTILYITGGTHIYSCEGMWNGINLVNGSSAQIVNASIIEDAIKAVQINQGSGALIDFCIFNKNYTAVELTANTSATTPLVMRGCVVTSRDIPFSSNILSNPSAGTVWANIVTGGIYPSINMKTPFFAYKSIYGVFATDVNMLNVGTDAAAMYLNGFDNVMASGVYLTRTNAVLYNNAFRNITNASNCFSCTPLIGHGVYAVGNTTSAYFLEVGGSGTLQPNTFDNIYFSMQAVNYTTHLIFNNTISNTSTSTAMYGGIGIGGIKITPAKNNSIEIIENSVTNCATAIWVNRSNTTTPQSVFLQINRNIVTANTTGFTTNGIYVVDPAGAVTLTPIFSEINDNVIIEAQNCISLLNVKSSNNVMRNSCMTRYATTGNRNGIKLSNCQFQNLQQNHTKYNVASAYASGGNILSYGIYLLNSPSNSVYCNTLEDAARSLVIDGNCNPATISQNTFRRAQDGFVMLNASAAIGTQGSISVPSNNYWDLTFPMINHIVNNATAPLVLWVNPGTAGAAATQPTVFSGSGTNTINLTAAPAPAPCGPVPSRMAAPQEEVAAIQTAEPVFIYPNPNNGTFTIETNTTTAKDVFVYDVMGKMVLTISQTANSNVQVDITELPSGIYFVKVVNGNSIETKRVVKQ